MDELEKLVREQAREDDTAKYQLPEPGNTDPRIDSDVPTRTFFELIDELGLEKSDRYGYGFGIQDRNPPRKKIPEGSTSAGPVRIHRDGEFVEEIPPYTQKQLRQVRRNDDSASAGRPRSADDRAMERWASEGFTSGDPHRRPRTSPATLDNPPKADLPGVPWHPPKDQSPGWRQYRPKSDVVPDELHAIEALMTGADDRESSVRPSVLRAFGEMSREERQRRAGLTEKERQEEEALDAVRARSW